MSNFWIIVSIVFSSLIAIISAQSRCAGEKDGSQLPMSNSRITYVVCNGGAESIRSCPHGKEFNPFDRECKAADNSGVRSIVERPSSAASLRDRCFNQADGTYLPDPSSRNRFIWCINGEALVGNCDGDDIFNDQTSTCDPVMRTVVMRPPPVRNPVRPTPPPRPVPTTIRQLPARTVGPTRPARPLPVHQTTQRFQNQPPPRPMQGSNQQQQQQQRPNNVVFRT